MKISRPTIPARLESIDDLQRITQFEDTIEDSEIIGQSLDQCTLKNLAIANSKTTKTSFAESDIDGFGLKNAVFTDCVMTMANFPDASWHVVEIRNSRCSGIQLDKANLKDVLFKDCKLDLANLRFAKLTNVIFENCVITELDLYNAELKNVAFIGCDMDDVEFSRTTLHNVDLTESQIIKIKGIPYLKGATINSEQLVYLAPYLANEFGIKISE